MSARDFSIRSRQEAERRITRLQKDFSAGMFADIPSISVPDNGVAYLKNIRNYGDRLSGRTGCREWGDYSSETIAATLPQFTTGISSSSTVSGTTRTITASGYSFTSANVGDWYVHDDGTHERIITVNGAGSIDTRCYDTTSKTSSSAALRHNINGIYFHSFLKKVVLLLGSNVYTSDATMTEWVLAYCESVESPDDSVSIFDEINNDVVLFNSNGIYKIIIDSSPVFYYKVNSIIPTTKLSDGSLTGSYAYRYVYGLSKLSGSGSRNRQTAGVVLRTDSGTNEVDSNNKDYAEYWTNVAVSSGVSGITIGTLRVPQISGVEESHWDAYSVWRTADVGPSGTDPVFGEGNNDQAYIWVDDVPIMKPFVVTASGFTLSVLSGECSVKDIGSKMKIADGCGVVEEFTILDANENTNTYTIDSEGPAFWSEGGILPLYASIGAAYTTAITASGGVLYVSSGDEFTSDDIGKRVVCSDGNVFHIIGESGGYALVVEDTEILTMVAGCWGEDSRNYHDVLSDDDLKPRIAGYPLYQRFYHNVPNANLGINVPGFMLTATKDDNYIYYSQIPDGFEYLTGYYSPLYQATFVKDGIRAFGEFPDNVAVYCINSTYSIPLNVTDNITLEEIGVSIEVLAGIVPADSTIGTVSRTNIANIELGNQVVITSEPAIRLFDGKSYSSNLASKRIMDILIGSNPTMSCVYHPIMGFMFWCDPTKSFIYGVGEDQTVGFSENTGYWPMIWVTDRAIKVTDEDDYPHIIVFNIKNGKFYDVLMRDGPTDTGIVKYYKDLVGIDGTGGYDIAPEITFKEDTGEYERFITEHLSSRFYVRPEKETDRDQSGYDSNGYFTGTEFTSYIYVDGEPTIETAKAEDVDKTGEIVYDRKVEGRRLYTKFHSNKSSFQLVARQQDYVTKDVPYDFDNRIVTEGDYQTNLNNLLLWISRGESPEYDRVGGEEISGTIAYLTGPDSKENSAFSISSAITTPSVSSTDQKTISLWVSGSSGNVSLTVGGNSVTLTNFSGNGSWYLNYASGITSSGSVVITPSGPTSVFDIRVMSGDRSSDLAYYYADVIDHNADNVCPLY